LLPSPCDCFEGDITGSIAAMAEPETESAEPSSFAVTNLSSARVRFPRPAGDSELKIDLDINPWLRAADQHVPLRGQLYWFRDITDRASDQCTFAGVADTGSARPLHGNVAGFGEFKQALETR